MLIKLHMFSLSVVCTLNTQLKLLPFKRYTVLRRTINGNFILTPTVAWKPDPFVMATDALAISWSGLQGYAFPPFSLVGRCLRKLATEGSTMLLVAPAWPHQSWYPLLLESLIDLPVLLPWSVSLLWDPFGQPHPLLQSHSLPLAGWKVSGKSSLRTEFLHWLQNSYRQRGARERTTHTNLHGCSGEAGVLRGIPIPFQAM